MTERQRQVLEFIQAYILMKNFAPSYMNIAQGLGLKSKSNIHRIVHELSKTGMIHVKPHAIRSLKVVDSSVKDMVKL
jgi:repressor LexA